jgi:hypothetical protein
LSTQQKPEGKQATDPKEEPKSNIDNNTIMFRGSWRYLREVPGTVEPKG